MTHIGSGNGRGSGDRIVRAAARTNKGHPLREARRRRAAERLDAHVYTPGRCGPMCPKKQAA